MSLIGTVALHSAGTTDLYPVGTTSNTAQRVIYGTFSTGTTAAIVAPGSAGWTITVGAGAGACTVNFTTAFASAPVVFLSPMTAERTAIAATVTASTAVIAAKEVDDDPADADSNVSFIAIGLAA